MTAPPTTATPTSAGTIAPITAAPCDPMYYDCEPKYTDRPNPTPVVDTEPVVVGSSIGGNSLVENNGLSLYTFDNDALDEPTCYGDCADTWPPLTVPDGEIVIAGPGVDGTLATTTRTDGTVQVTYNGLPLYRYGGDSAPGEINGDGLFDVWHLAKP